MSITCIGFDPNLGHKKCYYGCEKILPSFEEISNNAGFQHIDFYRVDCDESPDIWKFCGPYAIVSVLTLLSGDIKSFELAKLLK